MSPARVVEIVSAPLGTAGQGETPVLDVAALRERAEQLDRIDDALHIYRVIQLHRLASLEDERAACELLFTQERYADALVVCERALTLDPTDAQVYENHGSILAMLGHYEEALVSYNHAYELASAIQPLMWMNYATTLSVLGREEGALMLYDRALQLDPTPLQSAFILAGKGDALVELGRIAEAVHAFDEALLLGHFDGEAGDLPCAELLLHLREARLQALASLPGC